MICYVSVEIIDGLSGIPQMFIGVYVINSTNETAGHSHRISISIITVMRINRLIVNMLYATISI
jgi:hypothetical protein